MAEVEKARQVLDAERKAVLDGLRQSAEEYADEGVRHINAIAVLDAQSEVLLLRGKTAGVPVKEMAEALDVTRQRAHIAIRNAAQRAEQGKLGRVTQLQRRKEADDA